MSDPVNPPYAFRGPFGRNTVEMATSVRTTPLDDIPGPIETEIPISQLPLAGPLTGSELAVIVQNGITVRTTSAGLQGPAGPPGPPGPLTPGVATVQFGVTPPPTSPIGGLWFDDSAAQMYIFYRDVNGTTAWVPVVNQVGAGGAPPPTPTAPVNTAAPVVTGTATAGSTLTTTNGTWSPAATSYTYQWTRNGSNIPGATASTYLLTTGESGTTVRCNVTAINTGGAASAGSNAISILPTAPVNSVPPVVSGTATSGSTLTTTAGTWNGSPTFIYQWQRDGVNISGASASTYVVVTADQWHAVSCVVTATNVAGSASASSNALAIAGFTYPQTATLEGLFSVRLVGASYSGPCMKIERDSDHVTQDIGFTSLGVIDMAAVATFCSGAKAYCARWYDQSGHALDLIQSSAGVRPQLVAMNGVPYLSFLGNGLYMNAASVTPGSALIGAQTIGLVSQLNTDNGCVPISCTTLSGGWGWFYNGVAGGPGPNPGKLAYWTPSGSVIGTFDMHSNMPARIVSKRVSGTNIVSLYGNGTLGGVSGSGISNSTSTAPLAIGSFNGLNFEGLIGEAYLYSSALADVDRLAIDAAQATFFPSTGFATPYNGVAAVQFGAVEQIAFGNVLQFEYTQSWTAWAAIQLYGDTPPTIAGGIIFSNVTAPSNPAFPGYEMWVDNVGRLRLRVIHDANALNYIGLNGTIRLSDGLKHMVVGTYDGSGLVTGMKLYVDGVLDTAAFSEGTALSGTIINSGNSFCVGTQQNEDHFNLPGTISHFQLDKAVRSAAYIAPIKYGSGTPLPPNPGDGTVAMRLAFTAGSGTTVADSASPPHNGTLTSANMWIP